MGLCAAAVAVTGACRACVQPVCLLLQLSSLGFHDKRLVELLEHPNIIKVRWGLGMSHTTLLPSSRAAVRAAEDTAGC